MSIVGFNFTKISAERKNIIVGTVNINNHITLKDVKEAKIGLASDRGALRIGFEFGSDYNPDMATIVLCGDVMVLVDSKEMAGVLQGWEKNKQLSRQVAEPVMNHILDRCNVQALLLSKDLNLPSPVPLPKVQVTMPGEQPKGAEGADLKPVKTTKIEKKKK